MPWKFGANGTAEFVEEQIALPNRKRKETNAPMDSAQIALPSTPLPYNQESETQKLAQSIADRPMRMYGTSGEMNVYQPNIPLPKIQITPSPRDVIQPPSARLPQIPADNAETPFADSMLVPSVRRPTNLPLPAPIVEATIMKRGMPGSGAYGENLDLSPTRFTRQNAMTLEEAQAAGMIIPSTPAPSFRQVGRAPTGPNAGMGMTGEAERASLDAATRSERWGQAGSTTRSQGRASAIVDQIRATRTARDQSKIRSDEAMRTPQLATGTYVGQAFVPDGKGGGSVQTVDATTGGGNRSPKPMTPAQAANILKQAAQMRAGDKLKAISPDPDTADALENMLRAQGYDVDALKGGGQKTEGGGQRSEGGGQRSEVRGQRSEGGGQTQPAAKPKYAEGAKGVLKGVPHVYKGGRWIPE